MKKVVFSLILGVFFAMPGLMLGMEEQMQTVGMKRGTRRK